MHDSRPCFDDLFWIHRPDQIGRGESCRGDEASKSLALAEAWATALGSNQADALRPLLDATYEHIHGTGLVENKEQFLEALRTGTRKYQPIHLEDVRVKAYGRVALVTGRFALSVEARGKTIEGVNRFCLTLIEAPEVGRSSSSKPRLYPRKSDSLCGWAGSLILARFSRARN